MSRYFSRFPAPVLRLVGRVLPTTLWLGPPDAVYLTFDDGPTPGVTDRVLDLLGGDSTATFFAVGEHATSSPDVLRRVALLGHGIGHHGDRHERLTGRSVNDLTRRFRLASDAIADATGRQPTLMRPPYGRFDWSVLRAARQLGQRVVLWSDLPGDFDSALSLDRFRKRALKAVAPGRIIVLHDSTACAERVFSVLPSLLERARQLNLRLSALPEAAITERP